ncbi:hypothetical protein IDH44_07875 [Paenibacillus sp. IB182496]|uniref:Uncharacterized protein n=1 Tax=Paenibacillus sabuli TaxID=2772509 RepID=A0A927BSH6_9BACL|nr:hypothetical protein [Paenibacillus sabuli]MBD2845106.1 hypothetical protein [Paenibacillus sabuli]
MRKLLVILMVIGLALPVLAGTTAVAEEEEQYKHFFITPNTFKSFGSWTLTGDYVTGRSTGSTIDEADGSGGEPAIAEVNITEPGQYRVWVRDRDYATNQPGTRTFHVAVDGVMAAEQFGDHGQEGFRWSEVGVYNLSAGVHELALHDTSGFYARSEGFFLSNDLDLVPPEDREELIAIAPPYSPFDDLPPADFPAWATADPTPERTDTIENDLVRVVFYEGEGSEGQLVQNEIYIKDGGVWVKVKAKTEELGFLMMAALDSEYVGEKEQFTQVRQTALVNGQPLSTVVDNYFKTGVPVWFIPSGYTKTGPSTVELTFPSNDMAELAVTIELESGRDEPKVTLQADFAEAGAYSFMLYSGDSVAKEAFDTVTAPLLYVKKAVPIDAYMIPESYLFTPMATLHYGADSGRLTGRELTSGVALDPESVPQGYSYPDTSAFGLVLRDQQGGVRPQLIAPMPGTSHSLFGEGDSYEVSYRIVNRIASWYDTLTHVSEGLYNFSDLRTNYFHSLNEAIYNATDLMLDDDYGGWDPVNMAHYNMEERDLTTNANAMTAVQRYLLTENEDILDERAVPTLAYLLSRQRYHFKITDTPGGGNYVGNPPSPMGAPVENYTASVYGGLYEMTQGRMPFLMDQAVRSAKQTANLGGVTDQAALYKYTNDAEYLNEVKRLADLYLANYPNAEPNRESRFVSGFIYGDYIPMVTTFLAAYEATGEQKYLDAAEECARLLATGVWTTGYHNGYDTAPYTIDPVETAARPLVADRFTFWWHGDQQWRLGNPDGEAKSPQEAGPPLQEETVPGWLIAKAGMGTEHPRTPGHGNVITMNNWAGMLVKLAEYTGDDYFETMARNAMIGRFGNYPGYYQDRAIVHQMRDDYPYVGPDFTSIYWHHIPVFISMLEDFLINSAWAKSEQHIAFPSLYQSGYAYFASNQFGHAPGQFYDESDMWLWLDRGIVEPDTPEVDYIAARKDGVLGLALMNEGNAPITTTVALGDKVPGGASYSGTADVYAADGTVSTVAVSGGEFIVTIPAKGIRSVVLDVPGLEAPAYARENVVYSNNLRNTVTEHTRGKGHVIQLTPDSYYAYVYIADDNETTSKLEIEYEIDGETFTQEKSGYPYEFLIKVDDPSEAFTYSLTATKVGGATEALGGGTLEPNDFVDAGLSLDDEEAASFEPFDITVTTTGMSPSEQVIRFVVPLADFPFEVSEDSLIGLRIAGTLTHKTTGEQLELDSVIRRNEIRASAGTTVLVIYPTDDAPLENYIDYYRDMTIYPAELPETFDPVELGVSVAGMNSSEGVIRFVVPLPGFPFAVAENTLRGLRITGTLTHKTDGSVLNLDSHLVRNEVRPNGTTVLVIYPTAGVPLRDYRDYTITVQVHPPDGSGEEPQAPEVTAEIAYSETEPTADAVTASLVTSAPVTVTNNDGADSRSFLYNGSFTFEYVDEAGRSGSATAEVNNITAASTGAPAKATLSHDNGHDTGLLDGSYTVRADLWWGNNAREYRLYENGELIDSRVLADAAPSAQSVETEIEGRPNGTYEYVAELVNAHGTTTTDPITVTVEDAAPGSFSLTHTNWLGGADYEIVMNLWWGTNGSEYRLYENEELIDSQALIESTPQAQTVVTQVYGRAPGSYVYRAELSNDAGTTVSESITVEVTE